MTPHDGSAAQAKLEAERFVARFGRVWRRAQLVRASCAALAVLLVAAAALAAIDLVWPLPAALRTPLRVAPPAAALLLLAALAVRLARLPDTRRLALRAEEEDASLDGYLTTALDADREGVVHAAFARRARQRFGPDALPPRISPAAPRALGSAAAGAALLLLVLVIAGPAQLRDRWLRPADAAATPAPPSVAGDAALPAEVSGRWRVEDVRWTITPPAYTRLPAIRASGDGPIEALPGSRIRLEAALPPAGAALTASLVGGGVPVIAGNGAGGRDGAGEWVAEWTLAEAQRGVALEIVARGELVARRVLPIRVRQDAAPDVRLVEPDEDMVVGTATGVVRVRASARDDFGVERFHLAWIHSSGGGESFSFRQGEWTWQRVETHDGVLHGEYALDLADVGMQPGDVLHVRAIARDGNTVTGPGEGVSGTRVIRVARAEEAASITTLVGFPLEAEGDPTLSQRMLILMTERLRDRSAALDRPALFAESNHIGDEQGRLRGQVGDEIFVRLTAEADDDDADPASPRAGGGHDHDHGATRRAGRDTAAVRTVPGGEDALRMARILEEASRATGTGTLEELMHLHDAAPIMSVNPLKLAAFNAMWAAERELRQGSPADALPHQYEALGYIQQMREADRVFVRGRQRVAPIDVAAVRGTGRPGDVAPAARTPAPAAARMATHIAELEALLEALETRAPDELSIDLAGLAVRMLSEPAGDGAAATLVARAADAAAAGDAPGATAFALRARSALTPGSGAGRALPLHGARSPASAAYLERIGGGR